MNTKRFLTLFLIAIISIAFTASASWAGSARKHRFEGAVIGISALLLTKAIIDHQQAVYAAHARPAAYEGYARPAGYWDTRNTWVPGQYKKVWNPGHYDRRGHWVSGQWMQVEIEPGHWTQERVWVPYQ
jgi:hypothetical protein